jgi:hypothetical protein
MKQCPRCNQTYSDDQLNFCLEDGELLSSFVQEPMRTGYADDAPPTVMLNDARQTNPTNWPSSPPSAPVGQWQGQPMAPQAQFSPYMMTPTPSQTLAVVSLGLGIGSMTIGWCCSLGLLLSPAALITGFLALSYIKKDPKAYGGRGFAIGGIVTAAIFICFYILVIVIWGLSTFIS